MATGQSGKRDGHRALSFVMGRVRGREEDRDVEVGTAKPFPALRARIRMTCSIVSDAFSSYLFIANYATVRRI